MIDLKKQLSMLDFDNREQIELIDLDHLLDNMLDNIGSTDPILRDNLIYITFGNLIFRDFLHADQLQYILEKCISPNFLFYRIGEAEDDSVFTRSFSALVITLILNKDSEKLNLPNKEIEYAINSSIRYLHEEQDTRGHVEGKGWAHSIAHGADLLAAAIKHPYFDMGQAGEFLDTVTNCIFKKDAQYKDDEDERLLFAIEALLDKNIDGALLENWILEICSQVDDLFNQKGDPFNVRINVTLFLKSLYFRFLFKDAYPILRELIQKNLEKWYKKIYF